MVEAARRAECDCYQKGRERPFSGAIAVGMARLGGFDPEFPVQNGTRQQRRPVWRGSPEALLQFDSAHANGRLQRWPMDRAPLRAASGTAEGQGAWPCNAESRTNSWGTLARSEAKAGLRSTGGGRCQVAGIRLPRLSQACPNSNKRRESLEFALRGPADRPGYGRWGTGRRTPGQRRPAQHS